jgi:hypothetical protein
MRVSIFFLLLAVSIKGFCQANKIDSCNIKPLYTAHFEGLQNGDSITVENLVRSRTMVPDLRGIKISSFSFYIDGDDYDIIVRKVNSDTFSDEDLKYIGAMRKGAIIAFECILSKKWSDLISFRSFLFYIK